MSASVTLVVSEFLLVSVLCFFLLRYYRSNYVKLDVAVTVYLSWILGFAGVLLLPYDLSIALVQNYQSPVLIDVWRFVYWSTFLLAWLVLPFQNEYHSSGHFTFKARCWDAIKKNLFFMALAGLAGVIYVIYMVASGSGSINQVLALAMALSNTYGVLLITVLMGSGLVGVPKRLWLMADPQQEIQRLYLSASSVEEAYQEARFELEDCEAEVRKLVEKVESNRTAVINNYTEIEEHVQTLKETVSSFNFDGRSSSLRHVTTTSTSNTEVDITHSSLVALHAKLIRTQCRAISFQRKWQLLIQKCAEYEEYYGSIEKADSKWCMMNTDSTVPVPIERSLVNYMFPSAIQEKLYQFNKSISKSKVFSYLCRCCSIATGCASILILWCELVMASSLQSPIGLIMGAYKTSSNHIDQRSVLVQAVSFVALAYMSICTYWALFKINIGWKFKLQGPQLSPTPSLIFNAEYFSRLQFAMGYNFLLCLNVPRTNLTAFDTLMSNMELIPVFGTSFTVYMPIVIIIVAILAFFNGYSRLISIFGVQTVESSSLDSIDCSCMCGSTGHEVIESKVDLEAVPTTPQKSSKPLPFDFSRNRLSTAEQDRIMSGRSLVMAEIRRMEGSQTTPKSRSDSNSKQSLRQTTNEKSPGILPIPGMSAITVTSSRSSALRPLSYFSDDPKGKYDKTVSVNDDLEEEEIELYGDVSRPTSRAGVTQLYKSRYSDNPTTSTAYNPLNSARINSSGDSSGRSNQQTSLPVKDAFTISDDNYYRGRYDDR